MIDALYTKALLRLASDGDGAGRLDPADASSDVVSSLCGDRVLVTLRLEDERITHLCHETRACVLCQAAATLTARLAPGRTAADLIGARAAIAAYLGGGTALPEALEAWAVFDAARAHSARHACVLLPLNAALKALGPP